MLGEIARYAPAMGHAVKGSLAKAECHLAFLRLATEAFELRENP